jgi:phosphotransferase system enzyme I (PtsI)
VTKAEEAIRAKDRLDVARKELLRGGRPIAERSRSGIMREVPAAAFAVRDLFSVADLIHVGTNDLLQYFMAADRDNEAISKYYGGPCDDSFRSLLRLIVSKAAEIGREGDVAVCGEIASLPEHIPMLLGLGYRTFSIPPASAQSVRRAVESFGAGVEPSQFG